MSIGRQQGEQERCRASAEGSGRAHQLFDLATEHRQVRLNELPIELIVDLGIRVDQDIPKVDDATIVTDPVGKCMVLSRELVQRLTDDGELPLDGRAQHRVSNVLGQNSAGGEMGDQLCCLLDVEQ
jgi:hypothetical protein